MNEMRALLLLVAAAACATGESNARGAEPYKLFGRQRTTTTEAPGTGRIFNAAIFNNLKGTTTTTTMSISITPSYTTPPTATAPTTGPTTIDLLPTTPSPPDAPTTPNSYFSPITDTFPTTNFGNTPAETIPTTPITDPVNNALSRSVGEEEPHESSPSEWESDEDEDDYFEASKPVLLRQDEIDTLLAQLFEAQWVKATRTRRPASKRNRLRKRNRSKSQRVAARRRRLLHRRRQAAKKQQRLRRHRTTAAKRRTRVRRKRLRKQLIAKWRRNRKNRGEER